MTMDTQTRIDELEADLKAEWANLNAATEALRNLVFAVDHVDWDCTANAAMARLDEARSAARAVLAGSSAQRFADDQKTPPEGEHVITKFEWGAMWFILWRALLIVWFVVITVFVFSLADDMWGPTGLIARFGRIH
jgi:hypothetical protein